MEAGNFEIYPILHNGRIYNIVTEMDMTFREVRAMIDWLDGRGAFRSGGGGAEEPDATLYSCTVEGHVFEVDVQGFEIVIYRREVLE